MRDCCDALQLRLYLFRTAPESDSELVSELAISRLVHLFGQHDRVCLVRMTVFVWQDFYMIRNGMRLESILLIPGKIVEPEWILSRITRRKLASTVLQCLATRSIDCTVTGTYEATCR